MLRVGAKRGGGSVLGGGEDGRGTVRWGWGEKSGGCQALGDASLDWLLVWPDEWSRVRQTRAGILVLPPLIGRLVKLLPLHSCSLLVFVMSTVAMQHMKVRRIGTRQVPGTLQTFS